MPTKKSPLDLVNERQAKVRAHKETVSATKVIISGPGGKTLRSRRHSKISQEFDDERKISAEGVTDSMFALQKMALEVTKDTELLPHQFLLKIARGEPIPQIFTSIVTRPDGVQEIVHEEGIVYPDIDFRADAAKACAPYYAPRLSAVQVRSTGADGALTSVNETDLDDMIASLTEDILRKRKRQTGKKVEYTK